MAMKPPAMKPPAMKPVVTGSQVLASSKWLRFVRLGYTDENGKAKAWEACERTTRSPGCLVDAVAILVILDGGNGSKELLLVRQFRPPLNAFTIELPAGLVDAGETPSQAALRELKEETGLVGTVVGEESPPLALSPGLTSETVALVRVRVDLTLDVNRKAEQCLEDADHVAVLRVPLATLRRGLEALAKEGNILFVGNYSFATGLELGMDAGRGRVTPFFALGTAFALGAAAAFVAARLLR